MASQPYLTALCQETLRIYPVAPTTGIRIVSKPMTVAGYEFPTGAVLFLNIYLVHHREDLYPEPDVFKPERFLERQYSTAEFLPFGGGHRSCIGMALCPDGNEVGAGHHSPPVGFGTAPESSLPP
jgi:cytochrome P450